MMFDETNKAIYIQIADRICNEILDRNYPDDARLPSVREYAADLQVNANTVMRSYDRLQRKGIIYNRRGIGFFVAADARDKILAEKSELLNDQRIEAFFDLLHRLEITPDALYKTYIRYLENKRTNE